MSSCTNDSEYINTLDNPDEAEFAFVINSSDKEFEFTESISNEEIVETVDDDLSVTDSFDNNDTSIVWIPTSGKKYHNTPDCSGMKSPKETTLVDAENLGYEKCKRCYKS